MICRMTFCLRGWAHATRQLTQGGLGEFTAQTIRENRFRLDGRPSPVTAIGPGDVRACARIMSASVPPVAHAAREQGPPPQAQSPVGTAELDCGERVAGSLLGDLKSATGPAIRFEPCRIGGQYLLAFRRCFDLANGE
jgi:hypothetical protein